MKRMKRACVLVVVVALVALALGSSASAGNMKGRVSFEVDAGYAAFAFKGIGDWYDAWAEELETFGWTVQENSPPNRAIPYGVKFRYGLSPRLSITASAGAFSSTGKFASSIPWPADFTIDTTVSTTFFGTGIQIVLLDPPDFNIFAELEARYWTVTYDETFQETGLTDVVKREAGGSKIGGALVIGAEYFLANKSISLIGKVGYRIGKLEQIETKRDDLGHSAVGEPLQTYDPVTFDATDMQIDLSGWEVSLGLCFSIFAKR